MNAGEPVREAEAWFRRHPERVEEVRGGENLFMVTAAQRHAATIVRAWLARDVPAPAGRDLTPKDVRDALATVGTFPCSGLDRVADYLTEIARPSGGVGQPDTAEPRSWSLPTPPPDDVTVVHVLPAPEPPIRLVRDGDQWRDDDGELWHWWKLELLKGATVVEGEPPAPIITTDVSCWPPYEGEPPAPEPQGDAPVFAVGDRVRVKHTGLDCYGWIGEVERTHERGASDVRFMDHDGVLTTFTNRYLEPAPEPQAADDVVHLAGDDIGALHISEPPRFERGFYRLARELDSNSGTIRAGLVFVSEPDSIGEQWVGSEDVNGWVSPAALAAAGAERMEER